VAGVSLFEAGKILSATLGRSSRSVACEIKEDTGNNLGHLICQANDLMADNFLSALGQRLIELGLIHIRET
jgi:hypothetical protein